MLVVIFPILVCLTLALALLQFAGGLYEGDMMTHAVNGGTSLLFLLMWLTVRCSAKVTWLVCPALTAFAFYYFAMVDYDGSIVSLYYTLIVGITSTFFVLVVFSENWLVSTTVYAPLLSFYMWKTG